MANEIKFKICFNNQNIKVAIKANQKMKKTMQFACNKFKLTNQKVHFYHNQIELTEQDTAKSANLKEGATIDIIAVKEEDTKDQSSVDIGNSQNEAPPNEDTSCIIEQSSVGIDNVQNEAPPNADTSCTIEQSSVGIVNVQNEAPPNEDTSCTITVQPVVRGNNPPRQYGPKKSKKRKLTESVSNAIDVPPLKKTKNNESEINQNDSLQPQDSTLLQTDTNAQLIVETSDQDSHVIEVFQSTPCGELQTNSCDQIKDEAVNISELELIAGNILSQWDSAVIYLDTIDSEAKIKLAQGYKMISDKDFEKLNDSLRASEALSVELKSQMETMKTQHTKDIAALQEERDNFQKMHNDALNVNATNLMSDELKTVEEERKTHRSEVTSLREQRDDFDRKYQEAVQLNQKLSNQMTKEIESLKKEKKTYQAEVERLKEYLLVHEKQVQELMIKNSELTTRITESHQKHADESKQLQIERSTLEEKLKQLEGAQNSKTLPPQDKWSETFDDMKTAYAQNLLPFFNGKLNSSIIQMKNTFEEQLETHKLAHSKEIEAMQQNINRLNDQNKCLREQLEMEQDKYLESIKSASKQQKTVGELTLERDKYKLEMEAEKQKSALEMEAEKQKSALEMQQLRYKMALKLNQAGVNVELNTNQNQIQNQTITARYVQNANMNQQLSPATQNQNRIVQQYVQTKKQMISPASYGQPMQQATAQSEYGQTVQQMAVQSFTSIPNSPVDSTAQYRYTIHTQPPTIKFVTSQQNQAQNQVSIRQQASSTSQSVVQQTTQTFNNI